MILRWLRAHRLFLAAVSENYCSLPAFIAKNWNHLPDNPELSVDLGCGTIPWNPYLLNKCIGIDVSPRPGVIALNLSREPLPFPSSSVSVVTAHHFFEHVPRMREDSDGSQSYPFVNLMNECSRVLVPNGLLLSVTPAFPYSAAFSDPTHINVVTEKTMRYYFAGPNPMAAQYGYTGKFKFVDQAWDGEALLTILQAVGQDH